MRARGQDLLTGALLAGALAAAFLAGAAIARQHRLPPRPPKAAKLVLSKQERHDALRRAQVWMEPQVPLELAELGRNPPYTVADGRELDCRFEITRSSGMTAKFHCVLPDGRRVKVKYGKTNAETVTELAATRLLHALGFGADRVYAVPAVNCRGCPVYPYPRMPWLDALRGDADRVVRFEGTTVEVPYGGRPIESAMLEGWGFDELRYVDPAAGGAPRADVDALRLMAVFLANWDNKYENQRLVGLDAAEGPRCAKPFALMHDVGVSFGPWRLDVKGWSSNPVWKDRATCTVSMKDLPFQGATFGEVQISEPGRAKLARLLGMLSRAQLLKLFAGAGITEYEQHVNPESGDISQWVQAFEGRRAQISDGPPCP